MGLRMGQETQYDIPAEANTHGHELAFLYRHEDKVEQHDPGPNHPPGVQDDKQLCPPYGCYLGESVDAEPVCPDQKDGEEGDHADSLVEHKLCDDAGPSDSCAGGPQGLEELCRGTLSAHAALLVVVLLLWLWRSGRLGREGMTAGEQSLEEDVPAVAKLGLEEAVDGKLEDTLAVDGLGYGILGVPA